MSIRSPTARRLKAPSYTGFTPSSSASSRAKQANPPRDTRPELLLRRALWRLGLRYRTHVRHLPGCPDIALSRTRVAVFCDGDFWHGRNWRVLKRALERRANATYWVAKIGANRQRDTRSRRALRRLGWQVITLWETDIHRDPERAALLVQAAATARLPVSDAPGTSGRAHRRPPPRKGRTA